MKRARCVGGPLDGLVKVHDSTYFYHAKVESIPFAEWTRLAAQHQDVASIRCVTHIYLYDGPSDTWVYSGTQ